MLRAEYYNFGSKMYREKTRIEDTFIFSTSREKIQYGIYIERMDLTSDRFSFIYVHFLPVIFVFRRYTIKGSVDFDLFENTYVKARRHLIEFSSTAKRG